jgi:hypothetical protein
MVIMTIYTTFAYHKQNMTTFWSTVAGLSEIVYQSVLCTSKC